MAKEEWGVKRACPSCGVRFYDLNADPVVCPSCGSSYSLASLNASRQTPADAKPKPKKAAPAKKFVEDADDDLPEVDDDEEDLGIEDEVLIDDDEDDDDDDLGEIGEVVTKGEDET